MPQPRRVMAGVLAVSFALASCVPTIPKDALQLTKESLEQRQLQTRKFDTADEKFLLAAVSGVVQDLGFTLDESETDLGVIVASKDRDATETGQVVASILFAVLTGTALPIDKVQKMRASIITRPFGIDGKQTSVRVTFQRIVWNTQNRISKIEGLTDPLAYQEFFDKLSKSVFLEAHDL